MLATIIIIIIIIILLYKSAFCRTHLYRLIEHVPIYLIVVMVDKLETKGVKCFL